MGNLGLAQKHIRWKRIFPGQCSNSLVPSALTIFMTNEIEWYASNESAFFSHLVSISSYYLYILTVYKRLSQIYGPNQKPRLFLWTKSSFPSISFGPTNFVSFPLRLTKQVFLFFWCKKGENPFSSYKVPAIKNQMSNKIR